MAATISSLTSKPEDLKRWAERALIGVGIVGLFLLAMILYLGLVF